MPKKIFDFIKKKKKKKEKEKDRNEISETHQRMFRFKHYLK